MRRYSAKRQINSIGSGLLLSGLLLFCPPLFALRCGHSLVDLGDYKNDVLDKCGEPDDVESHYERRGNTVHGNAGMYGYRGSTQFPSSSFNYGQNYYQEVEVLVEDWVYDFGRSKLQRVLRFENGRLVDVYTLGKRGRR